MKVVKPGFKKVTVWKPYTVKCPTCSAELLLESEKDCTNIINVKDINCTTSTLHFVCPCCQKEQSVEANKSDIWTEETVELKPEEPEVKEENTSEANEVTESNSSSNEVEFEITATGKLPEESAPATVTEPKRRGRKKTIASEPAEESEETNETEVEADDESEDALEKVTSSKQLVQGALYRVNVDGTEMDLTYTTTEKKPLPDGRNEFHHIFFSQSTGQIVDITGLSQIVGKYSN